MGRKKMRGAIMLGAMLLVLGSAHMGACVRQAVNEADGGAAAARKAARNCGGTTPPPSCHEEHPHPR